MTLTFDLSQTLKIQLWGTHRQVDPKDKEMLSHVLVEIVEEKLATLRHPQPAEKAGQQ